MERRERRRGRGWESKVSQEFAGGSPQRGELGRRQPLKVDARLWSCSCPRKCKGYEEAGRPKPTYSWSYKSLSRERIERRKHYEEKKKKKKKKEG